jgi:hypothetical protein
MGATASPVLVLGWAMGMNPACDESGVSHLLVARDNEPARPACGTSVYALGGIETPPSGAARGACRRCERWRAAQTK